MTSRPSLTKRSGHGAPRLPRPAPLLFRALLASATALSAVFGASCDGGSPEPDTALSALPLPGPDTPLDSALVTAGAEIYRTKCLACHKLQGEEVMGPLLSGVTERRDPAWIRAMVLSPDSMLREDSLAVALLARYRVPMPDVRLDEEDFRAVYEFMRSGPTSMP